MKDIILTYDDRGILNVKLTRTPGARRRAASSKNGARTVVLTGKTLPDRVSLHRPSKHELLLVDEERLWGRGGGDVRAETKRLKPDPRPARRRIKGVTYLVSISDPEYWWSLQDHLLKDGLPDVGENHLALHDATPAGIPDMQDFLNRLKRFDHVAYYRDARGPAKGYENGKRPEEHTGEMLLRTYELYGQMAARCLTSTILTWEQDVGPRRNSAVKLVEALWETRGCTALSAAVPHPLRQDYLMAWRHRGASISEASLVQVKGANIDNVDVVSFGFTAFRTADLDEVEWRPSQVQGSDFFLSQQLRKAGRRLAIHRGVRVVHRVPRRQSSA